MLWLGAFILLAFYGLAISTIGGLTASGFTFSLAITAAILEVTVGTIFARAVYLRAQKRQ